MPKSIGPRWPHSSAAVVARRVEHDRLDRRALSGHRHRHVLGGQVGRVVPRCLVPRRHRVEEVHRLEQQLGEPEPLVERARPGHVGDAERDVVHALGAGRARQRTPQPRPLDHLELRPPRIGDVGDVERDAGRRHVGAHRLHQRGAARGDERVVHLLHVADVQADLADADLAPRLSLGNGRRPVAVEHLDELDPARARSASRRCSRASPRARAVSGPATVSSPGSSPV